MKTRFIPLYLLIIPTLLASALPSAARVWTDRVTGRTLEGAYISSDATHVVVAKEGGRHLQIAIARLSDVDKTFIRDQSGAPRPSGGLEAELLGYWVPDLEKTVTMEVRAGREINFLAKKLIPKMNYEFRPGKMMVHISGNQAENPPKLFTIKDVDQARRTLTLNFEDGSETTATFQGGQLTLRGPIHIVVLNRISKEVFASRFTPPPAVAGDVTQGDIPANRASGSVHGVPFTVEKAKLQNDILFLRQGGDFFADSSFAIFTFGGSVEELEGRRFLVKPDRKSQGPVPHIHLRHKVEGSNLPKTDTFLKGYSMNLEFGTVTDGTIPGKVHLRLPGDAGFVAGTFEAEVE